MGQETSGKWLIVIASKGQVIQNVRIIQIQIHLPLWECQKAESSVHESREHENQQSDNQRLSDSVHKWQVRAIQMEQALAPYTGNKKTYATSKPELARRFVTDAHSCDPNGMQLRHMQWLTWKQKLYEHSNYGWAIWTKVISQCFFSWLAISNQFSHVF